MAQIWIMVAIHTVLVLFIILSLFLLKKKKRPIDYYSWFIIGITWIPLGIAIKNNFMWILGLIFLSIGLYNKDKWKKNRRKWSKLDKKERTFVMIIMILLGILVLLGFVFFFLTEKGLV